MNSDDTTTEDLSQACNKALILQGMAEWIPDAYFSSRNSYYSKNGKTYARTIIRRWI